jgi:hypothetical protein
MNGEHLRSVKLVTAAQFKVEFKDSTGQLEENCEYI